MRLRDIEANFGSTVTRIVEGCSDKSEPDDTLLVSAADKLYNVRAIVEDHRSNGAGVWARFKGDRISSFGITAKFRKSSSSGARIGGS